MHKMCQSWRQTSKKITGRGSQAKSSRLSPLQPLVGSDIKPPDYRLRIITATTAVGVFARGTGGGAQDHPLEEVAYLSITFCKWYMGLVQF